MWRKIGWAIAGIVLSTTASADSTDLWTVCTTDKSVMRLDETIAACTTVIDSGQESGTRLGQAYFARGIANGMKGALQHNREESNRLAVADLNKALELEPNNVEAIGLRSSINYDLKDYAAVIADLENEQKLDPDANDLWRLARAYEHTGAIDKAGALYAALIKKSPKDESLYEARGDFYLRNGKASLAVGDYTMVLKTLHKGPYEASDADVFYRRGLARRASGDAPGADADFAKASNIYPGMQPPTLDVY